MESSELLMQAASGLERLMTVNKNNGILKDSNVAQISAHLYYKASVLSKLEKNAAFKNKFKTMIFNQLEKDFGLYVDAQARSKPKSYHHVYEWKKVGSPEARLFKLNMIDSIGVSFKLDYKLLQSKTFVPNKKSKKKYRFANKAYVMESGMPVVIAPTSSKRLVFEVNGITIFMPKGASVVVKNPGGRASTNQFQLLYSRFFSGQLAKESIMRSGFQHLFGSAMKEALRLPSEIKKVKYSFSPNTIRNEADAALTKAYGGSL